MEFVKILLLISLIPTLGHSRTKLPVLMTKQAIENIRFLSRDGKVTYYQRRSGSLLLGTNYKVTEVIKGKKGDNYLISSSPSRKRLLISQQENYQNFLTTRLPQKIYSLGFGDDKPKLIGEGWSPKLHLEDTWASFYDFYQKTLSFVNLENENLNFKIKLLNTLNPYFLPQRIMLDSKRIIFTDLNQKGHPGVLLYTREQGKPKLIYKISTHLKKIDLCQKDDAIIFGEFGLDNIEKHSLIFSISKQDLDLERRRIFYDSKTNDIGNLICDIPGINLYFIKKVISTNGKISFDAAELNLLSKKIKMISDVKFATQLINMDGKLLLPYQNKYFVLLGEGNMTQMDLLKGKK